MPCTAVTILLLVLHVFIHDMYSDSYNFQAGPGEPGRNGNDGQPVPAEPMGSTGQSGLTGEIDNWARGESIKIINTL